MFIFLKKCVLDFRVKRRDIAYYPYKRKTKLFEALRNKLPQLKNGDISLLCDLIDNSDNKGQVYDSLGIDKPKKQKLKRKKIVKGKLPLKKFLKEHFSTTQM